jgi:hypothetical protein
MKKLKKFLFLGLLSVNNDFSSSILSTEECSKFKKNCCKTTYEKTYKVLTNLKNTFSELFYNLKNCDTIQVECFYNPEDKNKLEERKVFVTSHSQQIINNNDIVIDNLNILNGENGENTIFMNGKFFEKNTVENLCEISKKSHISNCSHIMNNKEGKKQEVNIIVISEPKTNKINLVLICTENIINNIDEIKKFFRNNYKIKDANLVYCIFKKDNYFNKGGFQQLCNSYEKYKYNFLKPNLIGFKKFNQKGDFILKKNPSKELFSTFEKKEKQDKYDEEKKLLY